MPKKLTQDEWIKRAIAKHGNKYDYSQVVYVNKEKKVQIICPDHGMFEQIANNHVRGKGCPKCASNAKLSQDDFIRKASIVHNDKYDYSQVLFTKTAGKVQIVCPEHGLFEQEANSHLQGAGCPKCGKIISWLNRKSDEGKELSVSARRRKTCMEKYGVPSTMHVPAFKEKLKNTMKTRYGVENARHVAHYDESYKETMQRKYGVSHYSKTDEFKDKYKDTMIKNYGVDNYAKSKEYHDNYDETRRRYEETQLERYGARHYAKSDMYKENKDMYVAKNIETKRKNGTFHVSNVEGILHQRLIDMFGVDDVIQQYSSDVYSTSCDFYIKSRDMYIEYNGSWTHDYHWFDQNNSKDRLLLQQWELRAKTSDYYQNAIATWTVRDVAKRNMAKNNGLNYIVFWLEDLSDADLWFALGCPDGTDYDEEYSWLPKRRLLCVPNRDLIDGSSLIYSQLVKYYQQNVFYEQELDKWMNNDYVSRGIRLQDYLYINRYKYLGKLPDELSDKELLRAFSITGLHRGYSVYDSSIMSDIIAKYKPKSIFDPFSGWGERALMANYHNIPYVGVDINHKLHNGYRLMIDGLSLQNVKFIDGSALEYSEIADMVYTCPPYYDTEIYSENGIESNGSYELFLHDWSNIVKLNSSANYFVFQINQKYKDDMRRIVEDNGYDYVESFVYDTNKASHFQRKTGKNNKKEYEEALVFKRSK